MNKLKSFQLGLLGMLVFLFFSGELSAGRYYKPIRYTYDKSFDSTELQIIRKAINLVANRFLDPAMFTFAKSRYRYFGHQKRFSSSRHFESWFVNTQLRVLRQRGLPHMRIERMYERNSVMARAPVGIVQTYFSGSVPVVRGTFRIKLNHYNLGSASHARGKDVNYWAGVIAHELLHNLGHTHPHGKYHQLFIREYQNAIRYNALNQFSTRYLRISNRSRQSMTVYVKVRQLGKQIWYWFPSQGMLKYRLAPGQSILVTRNGSKIPASRARIFAHGSRGTQWNKYRNRDLLLVKKSYQARARGMFNYTLKD